MPTACPVAGGGEVPFGGALAAEGVADVGGGGENDKHVDDIGNDDFEHGFDEDLNLGRIGENRSHLDPDFSMFDYDDEPDVGPDGNAINGVFVNPRFSK